MAAMMAFVVIAWAIIAALLGAALRAENHPVRRRLPPGDGGSGDGGQPRAGGPEQPPGPHDDGVEPPWWPEFERDLATYVAQLSEEAQSAGERNA